MLRVLILGSSGLLGKQIYNNLKKNKNIKLFHTGLKKKKINLSNKIKLKKFIYLVSPNLIINTIGLTNIEKCEKNLIASKKINFGIIKEIFNIKLKNKLKFNLIHISTDQFYNHNQKKKSNENSKIFLMNNYCRHKRMAEIICSKNKALIFRTNFFGKSISKNKSFTDWIFQSFKKKDKICLFDDVYFNPLRINTIVNLISKIINEKKYNYSGIYNLGAKDALYKNEFAILFAKKTHTLHNNYTNINVNKMLKVKRSINMYMDVKKFEKKFKFKLPYIKEEILNEAKSYIKK